jgi:hypothetical protein
MNKCAGREKAEETSRGTGLLYLHIVHNKEYKKQVFWSWDIETGNKMYTPIAGTDSFLKDLTAD